MTVAILIGSFLLAMAIGVPVVWSLGLASIAALWLGDLGLPTAWLAQQVLRGADSLPLAAIPLFLFAGGLMNEGGLTRRIMRVAEDAMGSLRGGLGPVNVATAMVYGGITGSATADTGAVASVMIPAMEERGYPRDFSAAVTAASGTLGIIIPPSVVMILYGVLTGTSIGGLFVAGVIPGLLIGIAFMVTAYLAGRRLDLPAGNRRPPLLVCLKHLLASLPALVMPVVILGSMVGGIATATEAAAISVGYAFLVGLLVYRELTVGAILRIARDTVSMTGAIMLILAMATPFSWILTVEQVPSAAAGLITTLQAGPAATVAALILLLLFVGLWLDLGPALIILAPILRPIALHAGLSDYQFGLITTVALGIGLFTPPVGTNIYVVCSIARIGMWPVVRQLVPYWLASLVCLALLALVPGLTGWLPRTFGL
ncbi:MAG: TRAP transporter large permease [Dongiaceae bacterium]